jgi:hypothetical protein
MNSYSEYLPYEPYKIAGEIGSSPHIRKQNACDFADS